MIVFRKKQLSRNILHVFLLLLIVILAAHILWQVLILPKLRIRKIILSSNLDLNDQQFLKALDIEGKNWSSVNELELEANLNAFAVIRSTQVRKIFPATLDITIQKREPVALMIDTSQEKTRVIFFDEEGFIVYLNYFQSGLNLPVISGLELEKIELGTQLSETVHPLFSDIHNIREEDAVVFDLISEIAVVSDGVSSYYLRVFMNHVPIPVLLNNRITTQTIRQALLVLDVLSAGKIENILEADLRGETVVFRSRGEV